METGLVLSGGGFRGIAHIGVIKALEESNINISYIAGTSSGAIIGALYANNYSWKEILGFYDNIEVFSIYNYAINKPGFINTENFYDFFKKYFPNDTFAKLHKELFITATNLLNGTLKVFNEGELIKPILASSAFPGVFTPVMIDDVYYIDGGTLNNFPVDLISMNCDQIIGVYLNPVLNVKKTDLKNSYAVLERAYKIRTTKESYSKFSLCDLLISPESVNNFNIFQRSNSAEVFDIGYYAAKEMLKSEKGIQFLSKNQNNKLRKIDKLIN